MVVQHQSSVHSNSYNELSLKLDICAMLKVCDSILSDGKKLQFERCFLWVKILQFWKTYLRTVELQLNDLHAPQSQDKNKNNKYP